MQSACGKSTPLLFFLVIACFSKCSHSVGHSVSQSQGWYENSKNNRTFTTKSLEQVFENVVQQSTRREAHLLAIEAAMEPTFRALPKKSNGLLSHSAASFLVGKYFAQVHRYHIKGPGSEAVGNPEDIAKKIAAEHEASILEAPEYVEALLEIRKKGQGLTLSDVAVMASTLHSLIEEEVLSALDTAMKYSQQLQLLPNASRLNKGDIVRVFHGLEYMLYYDSTAGFQKRMVQPTPRMTVFSKLGENLAATKKYQQRNQLNPFVQEGYSTTNLMDLALDLTEKMGQWSEGECDDMKNYLTSLDPMNTGRIPLDIVYKQPATVDEQGQTIYRFSESEDSLRASGALDESVSGKPKVIISNYVLGPGNCLRMQSLHTYCCLNECEGLMTTIEQAVQGPTATPQVLLSLVSNLTTTSMDEPRPISDFLVGKLSDVAALHGGSVPLHGRLFAQWLHFAFPHECPYPHITQKDRAGNSLTTSFFQQAPPGVTDASRAAGRDLDGYRARKSTDANDAAPQWTDDEMLPFLEEQNQQFNGPGTALRILFNVFIGGALLCMLSQIYSAGIQAFHRDRCDKKPHGLTASHTASQIYSAGMQAFTHYRRRGGDKNSHGLTAWETNMDHCA